MKTLIVAITLTTLLSLSAAAGNTFSYKATNNLVFANSSDSGFVVKSNLAPFWPPYGPNPPANFPAMVKTNGLECYLIIIDGDPGQCLVDVLNHSTNGMACLRMPETAACRIALLDHEGHKFKKTAAGMKFGLPLSQEQIGLEFRHWSKPRQGTHIDLFSDGCTDICEINLKDIFQIKMPGEYELHLQMRLIQKGQDSSGKIYYPVTWLPEVAVKVQISPEDIPKKWWQF